MQSSTQVGVHCFILSVNCTYDAREVRSCLLHPLYNSSLSSTYRADLTPTKLLYTGSAGIYTYGSKSQDSVHVACMEIKTQNFEEVTLWRPDYGTYDEYFDTVLGLALFPTLDGDRWGNFTDSSVFHNMIDQDLLDENLFTLSFPRTDWERGEIIFGALPSNLCRDQMIEIPLDHSKTDDSDHVWRYYTMNGWQIPVTSMSISSNSSGASTQVMDEPQIAVIVSSFPWVFLPNSVADRINAAIGLKYAFDWLACETQSSLPNWTVTFGPDNQSISLTPWDYLIEVYDEINGKLMCISAFWRMDGFGGKGFIILGSPFLNGIYSVFDVDRKSISFSNRPL